MSATEGKVTFFINSLDFLSGVKQFKRFGRDKDVSLVGLIFTIILTLMVIIYSTVELINFFKQTNFSFISMEDNSERIDATLYIGNETITALRFYRYDYDEDGNEIEVDIPDLLKIFNFTFIQYNYDYENAYYEFIYYNLENCTNFLTDDDFIKFNLLPQIEKSLCPPNNKGIKLRWNYNGTSELLFRVFLCNKNKNPNCYSEEELKEKYELGELDDIYFDFFQESSIIDNYNYDNPITYASYIPTYHVDLSRQFLGVAKSKYIHYESDNGKIFNRIKYYRGLRFDTFSESVKNRDEIFDYDSQIVFIYYSININNLLNYKRIYQKLTTVIVDITGIARVLFFIGELFVSLLSQNFFSYELFDKIFSQKYHPHEINKDIKIYNNINSQISLQNNLNENKSRVFNSLENSNNNVSEIKIKKKNMINTNTILNEENNHNTYDRAIIKDNNLIKKIDNEKYSMILSKYLGYGEKNKKRFTFWNFICSLLSTRGNNTKVINSCVKIINNYLSLEQVINNGINIDIILSNYGSQEFNNINIFDKIIGDDFKKIIKNIKEKKEK